MPMAILQIPQPTDRPNIVFRSLPQSLLAAIAALAEAAQALPDALSGPRGMAPPVPMDCGIRQAPYTYRSASVRSGPGTRSRPQGNLLAVKHRGWAGARKPEYG